MTPERIAILDKAIDQKAHFEADDLYNAIIKEYHVSRSTVYNTLDILCECNILRRHFLNETQAVYELVDDLHLHLICIKCGKIKEIRDEKVAEFIFSLSFRGFRQLSSSTNIYGLCSSCGGGRKRKNATKSNP